MKTKYIITIALLLLVLVAVTVVAAQESSDNQYDIMAVFYYTDTHNIFAYVPFDSSFVIDGDMLRSNFANWDNIDWQEISYGLYYYQEIPLRYEGPEEGPIIPIPLQLETLNLRPVDANDLPHKQHIGRLSSVDVSRAKPLTVTRKFLGIEYTENCFVSQNVVSLYIDGKISIGDYVIVTYISETPNFEHYELPIVVDKVFQSWE